MAKKDKKANKMNENGSKALEMVGQLSDRHVAVLRRLLHLEQQMDERLEQLSERHNASIDKINKLEKRVDEQMEQLSERAAAAVTKVNALQKRRTTKPAAK